MRNNPFSFRTKIRLYDLATVRGEMCRAYRAAVAGQIDWQDLRSAVAALSAIAAIDQNSGIDQRIADLERQLGAADDLEDQVARSIDDSEVFRPQAVRGIERGLAS
jgi:hypothetical protein